MPLSLEARKTPRAAPPHPAQARLRVVGSPYPALGGPGPARLMIYVETQAHAAEPPSTPRMRASTTRELTGQAGQRAPARPLTGIANHQPSRPGRTIEPEKFPRPLDNRLLRWCLGDGGDDRSGLLMHPCVSGGGRVAGGGVPGDFGDKMAQVVLAAKDLGRLGSPGVALLGQ